MFTPFARAYDEMNDKGTKRPHSMKKTAAVVIANGKFAKIRKSGQMLHSIFGGNRVRMKRFAMMSRIRKIRARSRTDQANPTLGKRASSARGNMIPPKEPPVAARPVAAPRRREKK